MRNRKQTSSFLSMLSLVSLAVLASTLGLLALAAASSEPQQQLEATTFVDTDTAGAENAEDGFSASSRILVLGAFLALIGGLLFQWGGDPGRAGTADIAVPGWNRTGSDSD